MFTNAYNELDARVTLMLTSGDDLLLKKIDAANFLLFEYLVVYLNKSYIVKKLLPEIRESSTKNILVFSWIK